MITNTLLVAGLRVLTIKLSMFPLKTEANLLVILIPTL